MSIETTPIERTATKEDVRDYYRLKTTRTIELWMKRGWVPYTKIGKVVRFDLPEVQKALAERFGRNRG